MTDFYEARSYYEDWLSDNIQELRKGFIEFAGYEEQFEKYCKSEFKESR